MPNDTRPPLAASAAGENLPALPGIDTADGLRRMMGKASLYERVLREFHRRFREEAVQIRAVLAAGDAECAARRVHSAKGLAGSIGAADLQAAAEALETAIEGHAGNLEASLERFEATLRTVIEGITAAYRLD